MLAPYERLRAIETCACRCGRSHQGRNVEPPLFQAPWRTPYFSRLSHFSAAWPSGSKISSNALRDAQEFRGNFRAVRGAKSRDSRRILGRSGGWRASVLRHCKADRNVSSSASDATIMIHGSPSLDRHIPDASVASRTRLSACVAIEHLLSTPTETPRERVPAWTFFINFPLLRPATILSSSRKVSYGESTK